MSRRRSGRNQNAISATDVSTNYNMSDPFSLGIEESSTPKLRLGSAAARPVGTLLDPRYQGSREDRPITPIRRASSAGPLASGTVFTPAAQFRTPAGIQRLGSQRRPIVTTPHGRAAIRQNEINRAALITPGRDRRRSGRNLRESPRDILRQLSRALAPTSVPIESSPQDQPVERASYVDDGDDDQDIVRPRLSLPIGNDDEDDSLILPAPQLAALDDQDYTQRSIELPRRAVSEQPGGRLSLASFGSVRVSDRFMDSYEGDIGGAVADGEDATFLGRFNGEDLEIANSDESQQMLLPPETTENFRDGLVDAQVTQNLLASNRGSNIRQVTLAGDDETTFVLALPQDEISDVVLDQTRERSMSQESDDGDVVENDMEGTAINETSVHEASRRDIGEYHEEPDEISHEEQSQQKTMRAKARAPKKLQVSKHGVPYPSLPTGVIKKLATTFAKTSGGGKIKLNKDVLAALSQASDWFFEQVSDDLGAYADHAGRKTIDESDVATLMKRQRQLNSTTTPFSLAQKYLPRELLQDLRMTRPATAKKRRRPTAED